ncbi:MAG TPA: metalloregulator ArsR/SmtB family transcription factor [Myxococcota bacterium]|nr:metalloregulator ArsR/SmtB family transcription factor [Myxococcota bacterium]
MTVFELMSALSEPVRVRILALVEAEELGVKELQETLQLPQSTISRHLKVLVDRGLVQRRSSGTQSLVRLATLDASTDAIWQSVRAQVGETREADLARMKTVLSLSRADGEDFFGRHASRWDALREDLFGHDFVLPTLLSLLPRELVVADLGCGTGAMLACLGSLRVIGVDREPAMLDEARKRVPEADLRCGRLDDLPIEEDELDAALLVLVLHHVEDLSGVFSELARVLRGGGRAIVLDMVEHDRAEFRRTMGHKHLGLSASGLGALAAGHGLEMVGQCELARAEGALGPALQLLVFEKKG